MSRIESSPRQTFGLAGILLTASLAIPPAAQAQSISREQMLLNRSAPTVVRNNGFAVPLAGAPSAESSNRIDDRSAMGGTNTFALSLSYGGIGAEGVDLLWRGTITAPLAGQATVRLAYAGAPEDRGMPIWPVTALLFFSADDYRSSFIAELSGTIDWTEGQMLLKGLVTDGPTTGAEVEQLLRRGDSTWNGSLVLRSPNTKSVAARINGEEALLGRGSPVKSRKRGAE